MTRRSKKYFSRRRLESIMSKISRPLSDYQLCQLKIKQLTRMDRPIGENISYQLEQLHRFSEDAEDELKEILKPKI